MNLSTTEFKAHHFPIRHTSPPNPTVMPKCHAVPHAMAKRYFGLKTVQINKCVLNAVQLAMQLASITPVKSVSNLTCCVHKPVAVLSSLTGGFADLASECRCSCSYCTQLLPPFFADFVWPALSFVEPHPPRSRTPASDQYTGPAQFERNTKSPTARILYPLTPLYAFDRSTLDMLLFRPSAKNEVWPSRRLVSVV